MKKNISVLAFFFLLLPGFQFGLYGADPIIVDTRHYSNVFGETRNYRVFLPPGYYDNPQKKYPVIYFLHGWSLRYFGIIGDEYSVYAFDKGEDNKGDHISRFVSDHDVIVVKPDGYNREPNEPYYLRPYNVSPVETFRQFPVYLPELVEHIDSRFNTIADRGHRGICGLSMGGFMSYWIAGKYPQLFSAAGNFCGAVEFMVGPKNFPVEYRVLEFYKNYKGLNMRLNYSDQDFIRDYHHDMTRIWPQVMDNFEYEIYEGYHATVGLGEMLSFILKTFENPPGKPVKWDHIEVYPEFSVWDYKITSDRTLPGFTILENVDKRGFRCSVREFLHDGELMPFVDLSVTTPPLYDKNQAYVINDVDTRTLKTSQKSIRSDSEGRLKIPVNGSAHEIGINKKTDQPNICIASIEIENAGWASPKKNIDLSVKLLNKGLSAGKNIRAELSATRKSARVIQASGKFGNVAINEMKSSNIPFTVHLQDDSIEIEKFKLTMKDDNNNEWVEFFEIPIKKTVAEIKDFEIADGKIFAVAKAGVDLETVLLGKGNGDGIANPGESIVILVKDQNKFRRTDLTFSDPYINPFGVNIRMSDNWTEFDHVGASMKYDIPLISSDCPENHRIEFHTEYFLAEYPYHHSRQGKVVVEVKGKDSTPPAIRWTRIHGDNIAEIKVYDGSKIQSVKAKLILKADPSRSFEIELRDDGQEGDRVGSDNVFSKKIEEKKFGIYRVIVEATDSFGNKISEEASETFVVY